MTLRDPEIKLHLNSLNFDRAKLFSTFILSIGFALIIVDPFISNLREPLFFYLHLAHWLTFITGLTIRIITLFVKNKNNGTVICYIFALAIAVNGALVAGIDIQLDRGIMAFLITILSLSVLLYFNIFLTVILNLLNFSVFYILLLIFEENTNHLTSYLINGSVFCLLAFFLFVTNYKRKIKEIEQTLLIQKQQESIQKKNETMLEVNKSLVQRNTQMLLQKEEILAQRDEIEAQRNLAESQRDTIAEQNKEIKDSINYAKRIQRAVFPPENYLNTFFPSNFIFFKPKDIVSGDFFWAKPVSFPDPDGITHPVFLFCVADCTGHGIPGAFMSILGITLLNEIANNISTENNGLNAGFVLDRLCEGIVMALNQTKSSNSKDGMDMALCIFDPFKKEIQYAGANNSIFIVPSNYKEQNIKRTFPDNSEVLTTGVIIKPDKMPVGLSEWNKEPFKNNYISLEIDDMVYLYTDGFADQFGGKNRKKYYQKNVHRLLENINNLTMEDQKQILSDTLNKWKGDGEQTDDITIIGIKLSTCP